MAKDDIYDRLKRDHDLQRELLKQIADLKGESGKRKSLFEKLRIEIQAHAAAEEISLYATMLAEPDLRDEARHSVAEHKEVDDTLGELMDLEIGDDEWEEKFFHLRRRYEHHIEEEEDEMFPAADKVLPKETEAELGETYDARKPEELRDAKANPPGGDDRE